jgi:hypothetical protein
MKYFILGISLLSIYIPQGFSQVDTLLINKRKANTNIILGSTLMLSGIIMSQSNKQGHQVGIPCFMVGITLTSFGREKRKRIN